MKKRPFRYSLLVFFAVIVCLLIGSMVTYAAMMHREEKANLFQVGNLQTKIEEVFEEPFEIAVGSNVSKKVKVKNTGTVKQFVRVMVHPMIVKKLSDEEQLLPAKIGKEIILDIDTKNWKLGSDGYYYYLDSLPPEAATPELFTNVSLNKDVINEKNQYYSAYEDSAFSLSIKIEAINTTGYAYRDSWWQGMVPNDADMKTIDQKLSDKKN
ncbi:hypothetical protein ACYSNW_14945 [Enterococcus sp. LJL99]